MTAGKAPSPPSSGGRPPRRSIMPTTAPKASASIPTQAKVARLVSKQQDMLTWEKKAAGGWVSGQSMGINPGDPRAISRLRHSTKFVARSKKVIRPRTKKVIRTD